ncbi:MAG: hypothetical protein N0E59_06145, partial [Candidatus Thiodiazotropha taylori]|nr:hypothetical protein [Candidatus Thiodiazotropha taylori]
MLFAHTAAELQKLLDTIQAYCMRWKLTVNTAKTKIVISSPEHEVLKVSYWDRFVSVVRPSVRLSVN